MGGTARSTAGKRIDRPAVVCGERHQDQELLLPAVQSPGTVYPVCTAGIGEFIMLNDLPAGQQVYLITEYTDLLRSIDGLASIIQGQ